MKPGNNEEKSTHKVRDRNGNKVGLVSILPSKDLEGSKIIFAPVGQGSKGSSMRSTTELVNKLKEHNIPLKEIQETIEFTNNRLRQLKRSRRGGEK